MVMFARLVALEDDLEQVAKAAVEAVGIVNKETPIRIGTLPRSEADHPGFFRWFSPDDPDLRVTLSLDWDIAVAHADITASDPEMAAVIAEAFDATGRFGTLDEHLALLGPGDPGDERQLVRVGLAAVERDDDPQVLAAMRSAFGSPRVELRKAASYATLVLGWDELVERLKEAEKAEADADLRSLMRGILQNLEARRA